MVFLCSRFQITWCGSRGGSQGGGLDPLGTFSGRRRRLLGIFSRRRRTYGLLRGLKDPGVCCDGGERKKGAWTGWAGGHGTTLEEELERDNFQTARLIEMSAFAIPADEPVDKLELRL